MAAAEEVPVQLLATKLALSRQQKPARSGVCVAEHHAGQLCNHEQHQRYSNTSCLVGLAPWVLFFWPLQNGLSGADVVGGDFDAWLWQRCQVVYSVVCLVFVFD